MHLSHRFFLPGKIYQFHGLVKSSNQVGIEILVIIKLRWVDLSSDKVFYALLVNTRNTYCSKKFYTPKELDLISTQPTVHYTPRLKKYTKETLNILSPLHFIVAIFWKALLAGTLSSRLEMVQVTSEQ